MTRFLHIEQGDVEPEGPAHSTPPPEPATAQCPRASRGPTFETIGLPAVPDEAAQFCDLVEPLVTPAKHVGGRPDQLALEEGRAPLHGVQFAVPVRLREMVVRPRRR